MTATTTAAEIAAQQFGQDGFAAFLATRDEPGWVSELRQQAFALYQAKLSEPLDPEEWKRVDLRTFRPNKYQLIARSDESAQPETMLQRRADFAGHVTHVDGHCVSSALSAEMARQGVLFGSLSTLLKEHEDVLRPHLMTRAVKPETDRFSAWHAAFWTGGTVLYVPRGVELDQPLHSLIALACDGAADLNHTLVVLEENSSATLLEETASATPEAAGLHIGAVELILAAESQLRYVQLQNWNDHVYHFAHQAGHVARDAALQWTVGGLGGRLAHVHQNVVLDGRGADAQVNGVSFATGKQFLSYYTQQAHNQPDTHSDLLYKEVLRDKSRVVWRGMIKVEKAAQQTDGYQRSDALMLSPTSRCDSIPGLEIEADDVRCTHGATTGQVDREQVFYCMSRGLSEYEAMHIIVEGFFQQVFDRITVEAVRETLSQTVERKLGIGE